MTKEQLEKKIKEILSKDKNYKDIKVTITCKSKKTYSKG